MVKKLGNVKITEKASNAIEDKDLVDLTTAARPFTRSVDIGEDGIARFALPFLDVQRLREMVDKVDKRPLGAAANHAVTAESAERDRFGASLLETVLNPPIQDKDQPGTLAFAAAGIGRELAKGRIAQAFVRDLVGELLALEWLGWSADEERCCPKCNALKPNPNELRPDGWRAPHKPGCSVDERLTQAGLLTHDQREAKRGPEAS